MPDAVVNKKNEVQAIDMRLRGNTFFRNLSKLREDGIQSDLTAVFEHTGSTAIAGFDLNDYQDYFNILTSQLFEEELQLDNQYDPESHSPEEKKRLEILNIGLQYLSPEQVVETYFELLKNETIDAREDDPEDLVKAELEYYEQVWQIGMVLY